LRRGSVHVDFTAGATYDASEVMGEGRGFRENRFNAGEGGVFY
jgi:hypothetical protein